MKHNKIIALALLSSLALVGCGENNDLPNNDNNGNNNSSQSSQNSSQAGDSTSNDTSVVNPGQNIEATTNNKQAFYEAFRGALDAESKYRGNLYGKADGTVDGLITKVIMDGVQMDVSAVPEIAANSKLDIEGHAQVEKDIQKDDFNLVANYDYITGDYKESFDGKLSVYNKNGQKYLYSKDSDECSDRPNQSKPNEYIDLVEGDIVEHDVFAPMQKGIQEFLQIPEFKNFSVFEEAIKPQIEALKQQGYNISYKFTLIQDNSNYYVKLDVEGKGSLSLQDPNNPNSHAPFDKLNNTKASIELNYSDSQIKSLKASAEAEVVGQTYTENGTIDAVATIKANGEAHLDHVVNDSFDVVENSNIPESEYGEMICYDNFRFIDQNKSSEDNLVYNYDFYLNLNENKLNQKIDLASKLQPSSLKHSKAIVKNEVTNEILDINNYKVDSLNDGYNISYKIDDGYALIMNKKIYDDGITFNEIDLSKANEYVVPLPETIDYDKLEHYIRVDDKEYLLKDFYEINHENKEIKLVNQLKVPLSSKDIHYIYFK